MAVSTTVRNRPPSPGGVGRALRPRRALVIAGLLLLVMLGAAAAAAYIDDQSHRDHIAPGVRIGGVDVGGLSVDAARAKLIQRAVGAAPAHADGPRRRADVRAAPGQSRLTADLDVALSRARADSRRGWLGARVLRDLKGDRLNERIALKLHYAPGVLPALVTPSRRGRSPRAARRRGDAQRHGPHRDALARRARPRRPGAQAAAWRRPCSIPSRSADITTTTKAVAPKVSTHAAGGQGSRVHRRRPP